jgi:NifB/MoaA-like Fe-S oxidoreductase
VTDEDVERIITCRLEPMNVSIHAISPEVRRTLIGPHAQRGIDVLERLLAAGIEIHAQIVLCPGVNDGAELARTLDWVEARPAITSLAVVPLGYTRFSRRFSKSFSDDPAAANAVVELIEPYQERARRELGTTRFQLSDEFYVAAGVTVPPAEAYDGYPQYYDGIGMLRSFLDDSAVFARDHAGELAASEAEPLAVEAQSFSSAERRRRRPSRSSASFGLPLGACGRIPFATTTLVEMSTSRASSSRRTFSHSCPLTSRAR